VKVGALVRRFREAVGLTPGQFARRLGVAPQTVNRWQKDEARPRLSQLRKFEALLHSGGDAPAASQHPSGATPSVTLSRALGAEAVAGLGVHFSDSIMELEKQAATVWVIKNGWLRESGDGYLSEMVWEALRNGVQFHYVFARDTPAEESFRRHLQPRLEAEPVAGAVTGYCVKKHQLAYALGLSDASATWIVIEYSPQQALRYKRRIDVFLSVGVREYGDAAHTTVKNEEGQPCWIELSSWHSKEWRERLSRLRSLDGSLPEVEIIRLGGGSSDGGAP
jgi:transcriptional regulator with XRE-family HTH domain